MKSRNPLIAAALLLVLSGLVWWSKKHPEAGKDSSSTTPPSPKMVDIPAAQVKSITLAHKGSEPIVIEHQPGKWTLTKPGPYAADQDTINTMVSSMGPITADSVVEDKTSDPGKYGLSNPSFTVTVLDDKGKSTEIRFGDDVPAGSLVYASIGSQPKIYAVASTVKSSFDKSVNDLRDKRLLTFDSNTVTGLDLNAGKADVQFAKNNANDWQIVKPQPARADNFQLEELLRKLGEAKMDLSGAADDSKKVDALFASGQPAGTVKVTSAAGSETLELHKSKDDYYARSSAVKGIYKVSSDLGKQMEKPADDYRNKKLFDFGFTDPTKIELSGATGERTLTRSGTDWKSSGQTMDPGSVQAFIDKIRDLSAAKLVTTGFTTPAFSITVVSNDGKRTEKLAFAKATDAYLGKRDGDSTLYQIDNKTGDDIVSAAKAIKASAPAKK